MNATKINEMLEHVMEGIDTENPTLGQIMDFNNRLSDAIDEMPIGTRFTDGRLVVEKVEDNLLAIHFVEGSLDDEHRNNTRGSGGIGAFWSSCFGEYLHHYCDRQEIPMIPNGTLDFKLIEEE